MDHILSPGCDPFPIYHGVAPCEENRKEFSISRLTNALAAVVIAIIFVRDFFCGQEVPTWIDASLAVVCSLLNLTALVLWGLWLKRYLREAWRLEEHKKK